MGLQGYDDEVPLWAFRGTSIIKCGDSDNGRWHVFDFMNVVEKRSVVRSEIKNVHMKRLVLTT